MGHLFITGTDTEVGKTWATLGIMAHYQARGLVVNGMKPVASGSEWQSGQLRNADATLIQAQSSGSPAYEQVNPYTFAEPIAPHIAARKQRVEVDLATVSAAFEELARRADLVVVEGIGGWRVPLSEGLQTEDLVRRLNLSVVLVVGLRLGCINHALLSAEVILASGLPFAGWLANRICPDYTEAQATLAYLRTHIPAPLAGCIPYLDKLDAAMVGAAIDGTTIGGVAIGGAAIDGATIDSGEP